MHNSTNNQNKLLNANNMLTDNQYKLLNKNKIPPTTIINY